MFLLEMRRGDIFAPLTAALSYILPIGCPFSNILFPVLSSFYFFTRIVPEIFDLSFSIGRDNFSLLKI
jgi:hypothetical protein